MKRNKKEKLMRLSSLVLGLGLIGAGVLSMVTGVFAAEEHPYGIDYTVTDGVKLENAVTVDSTLFDNISTLVARDSGVANVNKSNASRWTTGYRKLNEVCTKYDYLKISPSNPITSSDNISYTISSNDQYALKVSILESKFYGFSDENKVIGVRVGPRGAIGVGGYKYESDCETNTNEVALLDVTGDNTGEQVFLKTKIELLKKDQNGDYVKYINDQVYFGITDIDAAQSYKILNEDNQLTKSNMIVENKNNLQDEDSESEGVYNMYVGNGKNYIYSQYKSRTVEVNTDNSLILVKLTTNTQQEGLNIVFGYANGSASSGVALYAKQYQVTYGSGKNGKITGIDSEDVIANDNPSGSTATPNDGYKFAYWTVDKDVTLTDGTEIDAGDELTDAQLKKVIVTEDLTFTANYEATSEEEEEEEEVEEEEEERETGGTKTEILTPDTGHNTSNGDGLFGGDAQIAPILIAGLAILSGIGIIAKVCSKNKVMKFGK